MSPNKLAPIVLFVYNRPEHTQRTVEALAKNVLADKSSLYIFSDGPKNQADAKRVNAVRDYLRTINGFENIGIIIREINLGLANSVISGVYEIFKTHEKVIVLEDDILTSPNFLSFMNNALDFYEKDIKIFSISGYPYPVKIPKSYLNDIFVSRRPSSWGWATWKDRWKKIDWEIKNFKEFLSSKESQKAFNNAGEDLTPMLKAQLKVKIDSWAIGWAYAHYRNNAYCLYPTVPLCKNIGTDKSGTHSSSSKKLDVNLDSFKTNFKMVKKPELNEEIANQIRNLFKLSLIRRIINYFKLS